MEKITRRTALAVIPICGLAPAVPAIAEPARTEIEELFPRWLVAASAPPSPFEEENWDESLYRRLQDAILAAKPITPRDVAIQFFVDSDQFGSDYSEHFETLVMRLIGPLGTEAV